MKATQYYTTKDALFEQAPVFAGTKMSGMRSFIRREKTNSAFLGCGAALTGSSCYNLALMSKEERRALLENVYGEDGLALKVARLTIGASDYSAELYSYDDVEGDVALEHFSIERDKRYIIPMIKEALAVRPDLYLFASPWSPPAWMKTGGSFGGGFMRREYIDCYAEYIVRFIQEYAKCGIRISALTSQNEVETDQGGKMPACIWHPDTEAEFVIALRKKLKENDLDVEIWLHDHNFSGWKRVKWMLDTHRELENACSGVAFHYYGGSIEETAGLRSAYPAILMHFTEGGPRLYDHYDTDWCKWGTMIAKVLDQGYCSFTGWNLLLDQQGGPNVGPFFCGGLITRNSRTGELSYSGQYKALAHIARFIKNGAAVCRLEREVQGKEMFNVPADGETPVQACCVENEDGTVCYVLVNANATKQQVQLQENGQWYYVELLPDEICTVVFEQEKE